MARNADGRLELIGANDQGKVWHRWQNAAGGGTGWSDWSRLDGGLAQVAARADADGRIELFGVNRYGQIWHRVQTSPSSSTSWSSWSQMDGELSSISLAGNADGRLEVFGANMMGNIWHRVQSRPGDWAGSLWQGFDGQLSQVATEADASGRITPVRGQRPRVGLGSHPTCTRPPGTVHPGSPETTSCGPPPRSFRRPGFPCAALATRPALSTNRSP
jgi:hypothetical protein